MSVRITAVLAVLAAALTLGGGAGAGAASQPPKIDLSSPAAIDTYLRSIGIDPATMIKQFGLNNYAGPSCPGLGWTCTTSTRVVQIAQAGGQNEGDCTGKPADSTTITNPNEQTCIVIQSAPVKGENRAKCREQSSAAIIVQQCTIVQDNVGGGNHADVNQENTPRQGAATSTDGEIKQDAQQFAHIVQDSDGGNNHSDIHQTVKQSLGNGMSQTQDGHQVAFVEQSVSGSSNFSHVHQSQDQQESGDAAMQNQNSGTAPTIAVGDPSITFDFDCGAEKAVEPNQCANVCQSATTTQFCPTQPPGPNYANNESHLHQAIGERQTSTSSGVSQLQGRSDGGQEGNVHQENPLGQGQNHDIAHQDIRQRQSSPVGVAPTQVQRTDPGCCGVGSQIGGAINREDINQAMTQSATGDTAPMQNSVAFGEAHQVAPGEGGGDFTFAKVAAADDRCGIDQHAQNNSAGVHFYASGDNDTECLSLTLNTTCSNPGGCFCFPAGPGCPSVEFTTGGTLGRDIAMPDYTAEPSDYVPRSG
jgi:hypothetical protein